MNAPCYRCARRAINCEAHGSGECCKGCYFFDERREGCKIGLPFTWEV